MNLKKIYNNIKKGISSREIYSLDEGKIYNKKYLFNWIQANKYKSSLDDFTEENMREYISQTSSRLCRYNNLYIHFQVDREDNISIHVCEVHDNLELAIRGCMSAKSQLIFDDINKKMIKVPLAQECGTEYQKDTYIKETAMRLSEKILAK